VTTWDRVQSMQLEIAQLHARVRLAIDQVHDAQVQLIEVRAALQEAIEARDLARRVAMRLEQENHALGSGVCVLCASVMVAVPVVGEAT
jgi:hypothetical protein